MGAGVVTVVVVVDVDAVVAFSVGIRAPNLIGTLGALSVGRKGLGLLGPDTPTRSGSGSEGTLSHVHNVELISSSRLSSPLRFFQMGVPLLVASIVMLSPRLAMMFLSARS